MTVGSVIGKGEARMDGNCRAIMALIRPSVAAGLPAGRLSLRLIFP